MDWFDRRWGRPDGETLEQVVARFSHLPAESLLLELLIVEFDRRQARSEIPNLARYATRFPGLEATVAAAASEVGLEQRPDSLADSFSVTDRSTMRDNRRARSPGVPNRQGRIPSKEKPSSPSRHKRAP
ncbi:MAG: hypothetical protein R3B96_18475 [Pirellulaceae bacterium]